MGSTCAVEFERRAAASVATGGRAAGTCTCKLTFRLPSLSPALILARGASVLPRRWEASPGWDSSRGWLSRSILCNGFCRDLEARRGQQTDGLWRRAAESAASTTCSRLQLRSDRSKCRWGPGEAHKSSGQGASSVVGSGHALQPEGEERGFTGPLFAVHLTLHHLFALVRRSDAWQ